MPVTRFPTRTLILMALALLSFAWFWWRMHPKATPQAEPLQILVVVDGGVP